MTQFKYRFAIHCLLVTAALVALSQRSPASERPVKLKDLPVVVRNTVLEQTRGAKLKGLSKEVENGKTFYEAETITNGRTRDILIDSNGAVVEVEEEVGIDSLPASVRKEIEARAGKILKVESVTKNGVLAFFEAHVRKGGKASELQISPEGKLITPKQ